MKYDIILSGVGGQGVLSLAAVVATAPPKRGIVSRQSEVHGMAQRGGAVMAHMRISDGENLFGSDRPGNCRYDPQYGTSGESALSAWLAPEGILITSAVLL